VKVTGDGRAEHEGPPADLGVSQQDAGRGNLKVSEIGQASQNARSPSRRVYTERGKTVDGLGVATALRPQSD